MTLKIPRAVLYVLAAGVVIGIGVAAFLILREPAKDCLTSSGTAVTCDTADSLTQSEYDQQQKELAAAEKARAAEAECRQRTSGLMAQLQEIDSRLSVGLAYAEYSTQVGNARVAYDRVPIKTLDPDCITDVALHLENAMNTYARAESTWSDCINDYGCDTDSIQPELQAKWSESTSEINKAKSGLSSIGSAKSVTASRSAESSSTTTTTSTTSSDSTGGFEPETDDCVSPSSGEELDCASPGAVDRTVYEESGASGG
jgi:hypothetical protein